MMSDYHLHDVPNDVLIVRLKRLVGSSNELTAQLLAHLAEVDARGIYRDCACATLYAYCVYELRLSEDEAQRRCRAARVARQFPVLFEMLANGSMHLTGILLLAPHLTQQNHDELLSQARYRTKREIEKLVADVAPCADAPSLIQPLGRAEAPGRPGSTWAALVRGWAGPVRELAPGDGRAQAPMGELARQAANHGADEASTRDHSMLGSVSPELSAPARETVGASGRDGSGAAPARENVDSSVRDGSEAHGVERYKVQFTADQSYVDLLEHARDLLQHEISDRDLARVHRLAIEALLEKLSKRKYAGRGADPQGAGATLLEPANVTPAAPTVVATTLNTDVDTIRPAADGNARQTRHVPANIKRGVWERDGGRCTFTDARGQRCRETTLLEFHHKQAFAKGGPTSLGNVTLHCRSHNRLAAEAEFGRAFVDDKRDGGGAARGWSV